MGTCFYLTGKPQDDNPKHHIGKRSAAGYYCWDCGVTLCKDGPSKIHYESEWYDRCPICGEYKKPEGLNESSAGRELGFNKNNQPVKRGVRSVCSFTWAMDIDVLKWGLVGEKPVTDEYGREYTLKEFQEVLSQCPIRFHDSIGVWFC